VSNVFVPPRLRLLPVLLLLALVGCKKTAAVPAPIPVPQAGNALQLPDGPPVRVLFIGNSLTSGHDVPGLVQAMAAAGKVRVEYRSAGLGGSLEDQWDAKSPRDAIKTEKWKFVVLQQGPSTLPESQANLKLWAGKWADEIRAAGAEPALYMVWSYQAQKNGLALAAQSYRAAADACRAKLLPAGEAWREALAADPELSLYSDGLHANEAGAYLAALVITHGLTGVHPSAVPDELTPMSGTKVSIPADLAAKLRAAAEKVVGPPAKPG
jgi:hypothetical protein